MSATVCVLGGICVYVCVLCVCVHVCACARARARVCVFDLSFFTSHLKAFGAT